MHRLGTVILIAVLGLTACAPAARPAPAPSAASPRASAQQAEQVYTIPSGTAAQLAEGASVRMLPEAIQLHVGDKLVIENKDTAFHGFGWFIVAPGQRYERTFEEPGTLVLFDTGCTGTGVGSYTTIIVTPRA